ncbi:Zinc finger protein [Quillaja saponaria]|uniref:Zinc finger protein n=1 Tax=Quillaja saponaria TaxID=32244 RepID=A0AAD7PVZ6_QUISA|nr:Zinc finger protein [Quillaja saponaria]
MEEKKICQICKKCFANGKAMGGHMRSHLARFPLPPKPLSIQPSVEPTHSPPPLRPPPPPTTRSLSSPSSLSVYLRNNPFQSFQSLNRDISVSLFENSDRESEIESYMRNPTRRRSRPYRKSILELMEDTEEQSVNSISYIVSEDQEAAKCLMMLSRDKWPILKEAQELATDGHENCNTLVKVDEEEDDKDDMVAPIPKRPKFQCGTCKKVFQSYQALGGHRASHKRMTNPINEDDKTLKNFESPFCRKVFDSGQALVEHKKVHHSVTSSTAMAETRSAAANYRFGKIYIDLNLPAP